MEALRSMGRTRQREPFAGADEDESRPVRPRLSAPQEALLAPLARRASSGDAAAGAATLAPRASGPLRTPLPDLNAASAGASHETLPDLNATLPGSSLPALPDLNAASAGASHETLPDLNATLPGSSPPALPDLNAASAGASHETLPDLNAALPGSSLPALPDLNVASAGASHETLPDLNAALPGSPHPARPGLDVAAASASHEMLPDLNAALPGSAHPPLPEQIDILQMALPEVDLSEFGIHDAPEPGDVFRLVGMLAAQPELEPRILAATFELLVLLDISPELRQGLEACRNAQQDIVTNRVVGQLLARIETFEANEAVSDMSDDDEQDDALAVDLREQTAPLGSEIRAWRQDANVSEAAAHAFDAEPNAAVFARMLARLRGAGQEGSSVASERTAIQVRSVIQAVAGDADLRAQVFAIAETALGSCGDNLAQGFSSVLLAVADHQMAGDVAGGRVDAAGLNRWAGERFRLSLLETTVNRFIRDQLQRTDLPATQRRALRREPLETKLHAEVALRSRLGLPETTAAFMQYRGMSVLGRAQLAQLAEEVERQMGDPDAHAAFMLGNSTWRTGMRALHPQAFERLAQAREQDPFFDLDLPSSSDVAAQMRYAELAQEMNAKWKAAEDKLLLSLAQ